MFEVFLALVLIPYYIYKTISYRHDEHTYNTRMEIAERKHSDSVSEWKKKVVDINTERHVYSIVKNRDKLLKHAREIESVLISEFGMKKGVVENVLLNPRFNIYDAEVEEIFSRILMANRGKLREVDAVNGIYIGHTARPGTWRNFVKSSCKNADYSIIKLAYWIHKQLNCHGVNAEMLLERHTGANGKIYFKIDRESDIDVLIRSRHARLDRFSGAYKATDCCETLVWYPAVRWSTTPDRSIKTMKDYK